MQAITSKQPQEIRCLGANRIAYKKLVGIAFHYPAQHQTVFTAASSSRRCVRASLRKATARLAKSSSHKSRHSEGRCQPPTTSKTKRGGAEHQSLFQHKDHQSHCRKQ